MSRLLPWSFQNSRADEIASALSDDECQMLSAGSGSKGERWYDWALAPLMRLQPSVEARCWGHYLLIRRNPYLVAIDLKLGRFKAEYKGQMEFYPRWLTRHEQEAGENTPLGIILCAGKLHQSIAAARARLLGDQDEAMD